MLGGKFLGVGYDAVKDTLHPEVTPKMRMSIRKTGREANIADVNEALVEDIREKREALTRRRVLAFIMSQYDPLGTLSPIWIQGKLLLQEVVIASTSKGWDSPLEQEMTEKWIRFIEFTLRLPPTRLPRSFRPQHAVSAMLITFADASSIAYGAVAYARWQCKDPWDQTYVETRQIMAKARVAPSKGASVPRLELQAVLQATRMTLTIL